MDSHKSSLGAAKDNTSSLGKHYSPCKCQTWEADKRRQDAINSVLPEDARTVIRDRGQPSLCGKTKLLGSSQTPALLLLLSGRACAAGSGRARWRQPFVITFNTCLCRWEHLPLSSDPAVLFPAAPSRQQRATSAQHVKAADAKFGHSELVLGRTVRDRSGGRRTEWQMKRVGEKKNSGKASGGLASNSAQGFILPGKKQLVISPKRWLQCLSHLSSNTLTQAWNYSEVKLNFLSSLSGVILLR